MGDRPCPRPIQGGAAFRAPTFYWGSGTEESLSMMPSSM